ncbi:MAG: tetratricopeptide repeat protein, partial [Chloroflexi bacterium]|nr:tetratricopeptide repeat protein [Chloroflexota bacterium]
PSATPANPAATPLAVRLGITQTPTPVYAATAHPGSEAYKLGLQAYGRGEWDRVIAQMGQVARAEPQAADPHYFMGEAYRNTGRLPQAIAEYTAAMRINAGYAPAYVGRGLARLSQSRLAEAGRDIDQALKLDPDYVEAYLARARLQASSGDSQAALETLAQAEQIAPDVPLVQVRRSLLLSGLGRYDEAFSAASVAYANDPTIVEGYLALGAARNGLGQYEVARQNLDIYVIYAAADPAGWAQRGFSQAGLKEYEQAIADFSHALALEDKHLPALLDRGEAYLELEQYAEAASDFNAALELEKSYRAYVGRGLAALGQQQPDPAIADFQAALRLQPDDYQALLRLGQAQLLAGQAANAAQTLSTALLQAGNEAEGSAAFVLRAQAYEQLGETEKALSDWRSVVTAPIRGNSRGESSGPSGANSRPPIELCHGLVSLQPRFALCSRAAGPGLAGAGTAPTAAGAAHPAAGIAFRPAAGAASKLHRAVLARRWRPGPSNRGRAGNGAGGWPGRVAAAAGPAARRAGSLLLAAQPIPPAGLARRPLQPGRPCLGASSAQPVCGPGHLSRAGRQFHLRAQRRAAAAGRVLAGLPAGPRALLPGRPALARRVPPPVLAPQSGHVWGLRVAAPALWRADRHGAAGARLHDFPHHWQRDPDHGLCAGPVGQSPQRSGATAARTFHGQPRQPGHAHQPGP